MAATVRNKLTGLTRNLLCKSTFYPRGHQNVSITSRFLLHTSPILDVKGQEIKMPSLSPTMTEGTLIKWLKQEGDTIAPGDVLCEIQTDKAVMSFETEEEGILAKIIINENTKDVKVGSLIALMVPEGEDWQSVELPTAAESASAPAQNAQTAPVAATGTVPGQRIAMPSLSPTMTEGTIIKWCKKEGDVVAPGDVICEIQTDKAVMSFETEEEGILAKILVPDNTAGVQVGTLIALMVAEGENWQDVMIPSASAGSAPAPAQSETASTETLSVTKSQKSQNYGPAVRSLLELYQLDSSQISSSGRNNKILKSDVLNYISERKLSPKPPAPVPLPGQKADEEFVSSTPTMRPFQAKYVDIELSTMRKTIAKRLTESKASIPHAYAMVDCNIDFLLSLRKQMKSAGINVSVNDFVIKAVALALRECPLVNCLYINDQVTAAPSIDISVAVATESGLITPIVKNANVKAIHEIAIEVKELATRAKMGKLQLHEFQGGSFTISNLGMFGISEFSAIINPPQCGILAVGGGRNEINAKGEPVTRMISTLSFDGRAISESAAADFLEMFQQLMENPANILVGSSPERVRVASL